MADQQFKPGDTVRLKSGGPLMTVTHSATGEDVDCEWFDDKKQRQFGSFQATSLRADDGMPRIG